MIKNRRGNTLLNIDWILVGLYLVLVFCGWINIYAAVYNTEHTSIIDISMRYGKQLLWIIAAVFLAIIILIIDSKFYSSFAYLIYLFFISLLVLVLLFGTESHGARSWFQVGSFRFQPAEFAKMATSLAIAQFLSKKGTTLTNFKDIITAGIIFFVPAALIVLQNDTGSALVYTSLIFVLYREGLNETFLIIFFALIILFVFALVGNPITIFSILTVIALLYYRTTILKLTNLYYAILVVALLITTAVLFNYFYPEVYSTLILASAVVIIFGLFGIIYSLIKRKYKVLIIALILISSIFYIFSVDYIYNNILEPHQQNRIGELLGIKSDPLGTGYNVNQSKIAIGSGGFVGKGFLQGTQTKYNFVPEQDTDFIFCTVGEEFGFIGSLFVILLFIALIIRIIILSERQRSIFSRIYGYCVASILFFHIAINTSMTIGLAPVVGIPLPFFSYGGSSLWGFTILLFIFIRLDSNRLEIFR